MRNCYSSLIMPRNTVVSVSIPQHYGTLMIFCFRLKAHYQHFVCKLIMQLWDSRRAITMHLIALRWGGTYLHQWTRLHVSPVSGRGHVSVCSCSAGGHAARTRKVCFFAPLWRLLKLLWKQKDSPELLAIDMVPTNNLMVQLWPGARIYTDAPYSALNGISNDCSIRDKMSFSS